MNIFFNKPILFSALIAFIFVHHSTKAHYTGASFNGVGFTYKSTYQGRIPMLCWACNNSCLHIRFWQKYFNILFVFDILPFGKKRYELYCPACGLSLPIRDERLDNILTMLLVDEPILDKPLKSTEARQLENNCY